MKPTTPLVKNQDLILTIDSLSSDGSGVARVEGFAVFVPGALPKEQVSAHIIKIASNYAVAKLTDVLLPSAARVTSDCPVFPACGGCVIRHMSYPAQLIWKRQTVLDALTRLGGLSDITVSDTIGMDEPSRYRNKGSFPFGSDGRHTSIGFFAPRSHRLVPIDDCQIQNVRVMEIVQRVSEWANTFRIAPYDELSHTGVLRHVVTRVTTGGETMTVLVTTGPLPHRTELLEMLADVDSVYHNVNNAQTNVIFGREFLLIAGKPELTEEMVDLRFLVSPQSFLQVNPIQAQALYQSALDLLAVTPHDLVFDVYCGIGTISLLLAKQASRVIGIENIEEAVADARKNALLNDITNVDFRCGEAETVLPALLCEGLRPDAIVIDPPRKGCDPKVIDAILSSTARRVAYVSCNPSTMARDLRLLTDGGFRVVHVQPVDMFPHTAHIECTAYLVRSDG